MPELPPLGPLSTIESVEEWTQHFDNILKRSTLRGRTFNELNDLAVRVRRECNYWRELYGYLNTEVSDRDEHDHS